MEGFAQAMEHVAGQVAEGIHPAEGFEIKGIGGFYIAVGLAVPLVPGDPVVRLAPGFVVVLAPHFVRGKATVSVIRVPGVGIKSVFTAVCLTVRTVKPPRVIQGPVEVAVVPYPERVDGTGAGIDAARLPMPDIIQVPGIGPGGPFFGYGERLVCPRADVLVSGGVSAADLVK